MSIPMLTGSESKSRATTNGGPSFKTQVPYMTVIFGII